MADQALDLSGIERNDIQTDVIADYWSRSFASLGERDTFVLFSKKYSLLANQNEGEATAALKGFRRLCRLRGRLDRFDSYWAAK